MEKKYWNALTVLRQIRRWIFSLVLIIFPVVSWCVPSSLTTVSLNKYDNYTRLIFKINAPNKYRVFVLAHPDRLVVDFDHAVLHADVKHLSLRNTAIKSVRNGRPVPSMLRLVFDLNSPVDIKTYLSSQDLKESQLAVDLYPKQNASEPPAPVPALKTAKPVAEIKQTPEPAKKMLAKLEESDIKKISSATKTRPAVVKEFDLVEEKKQTRMQTVEVVKSRRLVIVVDAGHGGKDPGTVGQQGTKEKDVVLKIALRLAELINQEPGLHAALTREGDYFVTLKDRLHIARKSKADLFLAIHADSYFDTHSTGASVYALSQHGASSMAARWLADKENHSELGGVDLNGLEDHSYLLRSVLIDLAETATIVDSVRFGTDMLTALESVTSLHYARVEQAPFMVLKSPDIPSVLVEMGFLSNLSEEQHLRDAAYRDKLAHALLAGIRQYVATHPMMANNSKPVMKEIPI